MVATMSFHKEVGRTGRCRGRIGKFGRVIMQIEVIVNVVSSNPYNKEVLNTYIRWRDAGREDVLETRIYQGVPDNA